MLAKLRLKKSKLKWHQLYYLLAVIDILTILAALTLTQVLMDTYENSVEVNQKMSSTVSEFIKLGYIAQNVNEPGNRIFESKNIEVETRALRQHQARFDSAFTHAYQNLGKAFAEKDIEHIQGNLNQLKQSMELMVNETYLIFKFVEQDDLVIAGQHMSTMDAYYYQVTQAIGGISQHIADIQNNHFKAQIQKAKSVKRYEIAISIVVLVIIVLVTVYGHKLGKQIQAKDRKIKQSLIEAKQSTRAKSEFLANMSHEIRTPMNAILGMLKLIDDSKLSNEDKNYLALASSSADNLLVIINDILELSKSESNNLQLEALPFNLAELLSKQVQIYQLTNKSTDLKLTVDLNAVSTPHLIGDYSRIIQVINNLLNNAFKFTHQGEISIVANTQQLDDNVEVSIDVKDSGIGIDADKLDTIFESFSQADSSTSRKYGGTGLGLAISRKICRLMSGDLIVESKAGEGSCFSVKLLLSAAEKPISKVAQHHEQEQNQQALNLHLLVAEDNRVNQVLIKKLLANISCTCDIASNGQEAVDMLSEQHQAILMDCSMPVLDGFEATQAIRALNDDRAKVNIIAVTANSMPEDQQKCLDAGMNSYISKPIEFDKLYQALKQLVC